MVTFEDISADIIRAIITSMLVSQKYCRSVTANKIFKSMAPADIFGLLDFSSRLLMPWAGIAYVREALHGCKDIELLLGLASKRTMFDGTDEEAEWKEVLDLVCQRMALVVEEVAASPEFAHIGIKMLECMVGYITHGEWSEETVHVVPCENKVGHLRSKVNSQGFHMRIEEGQNVKRFGVFIDTDSAGFVSLQHPTTLPSCVPVVADSEVTAKALFGAKFQGTAPHRAYDAKTTSGWGWPQFLPASNQERFRLNNSFELSFRTRTSKVHRQSLALLKFYEKNLRPAIGSSMHHSILLDAWRYSSKALNENMATILRDFMCVIFLRIDMSMPEFFHLLTCSELENVIEQDLLESDKKEMRILKVVINWARHRSSQAGNLEVGDEVRVKHDCYVHEGWRGADCVVKALLQGGNRVLLERLTGGQASSQTQTLDVAVKNVHDAASTGMMRLLVHVRHAFVPLLELRKELSNEEINFASKYVCFLDMVKDMAKIQTGKEAAKATVQAKGRPNYKALAVVDPIDALTSLLTHSDGPEVLEKRVDEEIKKRNLRSCQQVEKLVTDSITKDNLLGREEVKDSICARINTRQQHIREKSLCSVDMEAIISERIKKGHLFSPGCVEAVVSERIKQGRLWDNAGVEEVIQQRVVQGRLFSGLDVEKVIADRIKLGLLWNSEGVEDIVQHRIEQEQRRACASVEDVIHQRVVEGRLFSPLGVEAVVAQRIEKGCLYSPAGVEELIQQRIKQEQLFTAQDIDRIIAERMEKGNFTPFDGRERLLGGRTQQAQLSSTHDVERIVAERVSQQEQQLDEINKNSTFGSYATVDEHRAYITDECRRAAGSSYAERVRHMMPSIPPRCESPKTGFARTAQNVVDGTQRDGSARQDGMLGYEEGWVLVQRHAKKKGCTRVERRDSNMA
jgi:hypothetical protein